MDKPFGIIVFGANGSGKTTLGRELAHILNFKHMDHEDYCFEKSEIPYTISRPREEVLALMLKDIEKYRSFIISACIGDFGEKIEQLYDLAIYMQAPLELRIERVKQRNIERFGKRVSQNGDMYEQQSAFVDFVTRRPLSKIEQWARTLTCPVLHIDGTTDYQENAANIATQLHDKFHIK